MKVRVKFAKEGAMKFIGHLDIMRYFQKAVKRANLDVAFFRRIQSTYDYVICLTSRSWNYKYR